MTTFMNTDHTKKRYDWQKQYRVSVEISDDIWAADEGQAKIYIDELVTRAFHNHDPYTPMPEWYRINASYVCMDIDEEIRKWAAQDALEEAKFPNG